MLGLEFSCIRERDNSSDLYAVAVKKAQAKGHMQFKVCPCAIYFIKGKILFLTRMPQSAKVSEI